MKKLLKYLSPFAPDHSGAVSALFEFGGLLVVCDAGGCTGNVCGFDEPRWFHTKSAVFSAGLRDMDAILGRDDKLVQKIQLAMRDTGYPFSAIIGTPAPAIIATDFRALKRMTEKSTGKPAVCVPSTGTNLYDKGASAAFLELFKTFATEKVPVEKQSLGVLGVTPLDFGRTDAGDVCSDALSREGWKRIFCYGMGAGLDDVRSAARTEMNLVVSPCGLAAAKYLRDTFGTPYKVSCPYLPHDVMENLKSLEAENVLVIHQQFAANAVRELLPMHADVASFFSMLPEYRRENDSALTSEEQLAELVRINKYDAIVADGHLKRVLPDFHGSFLDFKHFAVSGRLEAD